MGVIRSAAETLWERDPYIRKHVDLACDHPSRSYFAAAVLAVKIQKWWFKEGVWFRLPRFSLRHPVSRHGTHTMWCPPTGVYTRPRLRNACKNPYCPWCYARRWSDTYMRMYYLLKNPFRGFWRVTIYGHFDDPPDGDDLPGLRRWLWRARRRLGITTSLTSMNVIPCVPLENKQQGIPEAGAYPTGWMLRAETITPDVPRRLTLRYRRSRWVIGG